jgi:hypothetical protein
VLGTTISPYLFFASSEGFVGDLGLSAGVE